MSRAALPLTPPEAFFTNLADKLLEQQMGLRLAQIQIAPSNQYSAPVHRIFQVTANIHDAMNTNACPAVFRPLFVTNGATVLLGGFSSDSRVSTMQEWIDSNPYGVPLVIAARKGIPNFNEFTLRTDFLVGRKAQFIRPDTNSPPNLTNQIYYLGISNMFGLEAWNAYSRDYPPPGQQTRIEITNNVTVSISNLFLSQPLVYVTNFAIGRTDVSNFGPLQFHLPLMDFSNTLANSRYRVLDGSFDSLTNVFESPSGFDYPYFIVTVSNQLTYLHSDGEHVLDFVTLRTCESIDLQQELMKIDSRLRMWDTNLVTAGNGLTAGLSNQINIALGLNPVSASDFSSYTDGPLTLPVDWAIANGRAFFRLPHLIGKPAGTNTFLAMVSPFNPAIRFAHVRTWQANDPLVHYHVDDLMLYPSNQVSVLLKPVLLPALSQAPTSFSNSVVSLGTTNDCVAPWGNALWKAYDPFSWVVGLRDPSVYSADYWNFPANESMKRDWLGRVHRGTPWQTIYLKAEVASPQDWYMQGHRREHHPTNDWKLAALVAAEFNTNACTNLFSINSQSWTTVLAGLTVVSNTLAFGNLGPGRVPEFSANVINSDDSPVGIIATRINARRATRPSHYFTDVDSWLATPELSTASPWLNQSDPVFAQYGITDEAYEMLPSQLLGLVRADPAGRLTRQADQVLLHFNGCCDGTYEIESSADLNSWSGTGITCTATNREFNVSLSYGSGGGFFRAHLLP